MDLDVGVNIDIVFFFSIMAMCRNGYCYFYSHMENLDGGGGGSQNQINNSIQQLFKIYYQVSEFGFGRLLSSRVLGCFWVYNMCLIADLVTFVYNRRNRPPKPLNSDITTGLDYRVNQNDRDYQN